MWYTRAQVCCDAITVLLRKLYIKTIKLSKIIWLYKKKVTLLLYQTEQKSTSELTEELFVIQVFLVWFVKTDWSNFLAFSRSISQLWMLIHNWHILLVEFFKLHLPLPPLGPNCRIKVFKNSPAALSKDNVSKVSISCYWWPFSPKHQYAYSPYCSLLLP